MINSPFTIRAALFPTMASILAFLTSSVMEQRHPIQNMIQKPSLTRTITKGNSKITIRSTEIRPSSSDEISLPWGTSKESAWRIIASVEIWIGKKSIDVPWSAFSGLANLHDMKLTLSSGGCVVHLVGGDASISWTADITTDNKRVIRRIVRSGEFPENVWEETRYNLKFPENM